MEKLYRLPEYIKPSHYKITIKPSFHTLTYIGSVEINLSVSKESSCIFMHSRNLVIAKVVLVDPDKSINWVGTVSNATEYIEDTVKLVFDQKDVITAGDYLLQIDFEGTISETEERGFYCCVDKERTANERIAHSILTTKFEPISARTTFPCFDQPDMKTTFKINILVPEKGMIAISNTACNKQFNTFEGMWYEFENTPKMSTYLVAWVIGYFDVLEKVSKTGITIGVYMPVGRKNEGKFALEVASDCVDFFSNFLELPYTPKKLDLVSVHKSSSPAMENWGCVIFVPTSLLLEEEEYEFFVAYRTARTICHEIAHMWFGNIVTLRWWNDVWLNESFARYFEHFALDTIKPQFHVWDLYYPHVLERGFKRAILPEAKTVHSEEEQKSVKEIEEVFDSVVYNKGSSVLKMFSDYMGKDKFLNGVKNYLHKHKFGNAVTNDLMEFIVQVSGKPINTLIKNWIDIRGYPILSVSQHPTKEKFVVVKQRSCFESDNTLWSIPINYQTSTIKHNTILMESEEIEIEYEEFIKLNTGHKGFYRVNYDYKLFNKLLKNANKLTTIDICLLFSDLIEIEKNIWLSNHVEKYIECFLEFTKVDYMVVSTLQSLLTQVFPCLDTSQRGKLKATVNSKFTKHFVDEGEFDKMSDDSIEAYKRLKLAEVLGLMCDNKTVIDAAVKKFNTSYKSKFKGFSLDLKLLVCQLACTASDDAAKYIKISIQKEKAMIKGCMSPEKESPGDKSETKEDTKLHAGQSEEDRSSSTIESKLNTNIKEDAKIDEMSEKSTQIGEVKEDKAIIPKKKEVEEINNSIAILYASIAYYKNLDKNGIIKIVQAIYGKPRIMNHYKSDIKCVMFTKNCIKCAQELMIANKYRTLQTSKLLRSINYTQLSVLSECKEEIAELLKKADELIIDGEHEWTKRWRQPIRKKLEEIEKKCNESILGNIIDSLFTKALS